MQGWRRQSRGRRGGGKCGDAFRFLSGLIYEQLDAALVEKVCGEKRNEQLATKAGNEPEQKGYRRTEENRGCDWEVKRSVPATVDNVAGQSSDAER